MFCKTIAYLILIIIVLSHPDTTFQYAYEGLQQWALKMVPTLFPFMMISSVMIYSGADMELGHILSYPLKHIYKYSAYGLYAIFMGFFCGFPMGAKVISELYEANKLSKEEAVSLLGFCNNIGPAYFLGIIIPMLHACGFNSIFPFIFGMYGIPAIYGIFLSRQNKSTSHLHITEAKEMSLTGCLKKACAENTQSIIILGGYITFINAFRIFLDFFMLSDNVKCILSGFLEIMGGIQIIYTSSLPPAQKVLWTMTALCFSGISCLMQAACFIEKVRLPFSTYIKHRILLTLISFFYYILIIYIF